MLVAAAATDNSSSINHSALLSAIVVFGFDDDDGVEGDARLCLFIPTLNLLATTNGVWLNLLVPCLIRCLLGV